MNNNPTGRNQYTGKLRNKSTTLYHGTRAAFSGVVKSPSKFEPNFATTSLKMAKAYAGLSLNIKRAGDASRVLMVRPLAKTLNIKRYNGDRRHSMLAGASIVWSPKPMRIVGSVKFLKHNK